MVVAATPRAYMFNNRQEVVLVPHRITEECQNCGACLAECPEGAISEGPERHTIDVSKCTDCGTCAEICPMEAIIEGE